MYVCMYVCTCVSIYLHTYILTYLHICESTFIHTHITNKKTFLPMYISKYCNVLYCIVLNLYWLIKRYIYKKKAPIKLKWWDGETNPLTAAVGLTLKHIQFQSLPIV